MIASPRRLLAYAIVALVVVLAAALAVSVYRLHRERAAHERDGVRADSVLAAGDTMRAVLLRERDRAALLGDSLQAMERRSVQLIDPKRDALDNATGRTSVLRGHVDVTPGTIHTTAGSSSATVSDSGVRSATFHIDSSAAASGPRYTADASVTVPLAPASATLALDVRFVPITLSPRLQCGAPDASGIRPATLGVIAPAGVTLAIGTSDVDVHACNPDYGRPSGIRVSLTTAALLASAAALATAIVLR